MSRNTDGFVGIPLLYDQNASLPRSSTDLRTTGEIKFIDDASATTSVSPTTSPSRPTHHFWKPRILRLPVTLSTAILFLALIGILEAFVRLSHSQSGFAVPSNGACWALTYGPIVGFVCMGLVWKSWELEVKKLMPWADMRTRPIRAKDSILLDYVGANYVEVLWIAAKHKHWPVLLAILGSGMFAVCNIAATSLWTISLVPVLQRTQLRQTTVFEDAFNYDATGYLAGYFGHLLYAVPTPEWTYNNHVLASFERIGEGEPPWLLSAITSGYSATLSCETIPIEVDNGEVVWMEDGNLTVPALSVTAPWHGCGRRFNVSGFDIADNVPTLIGQVDEVICRSERATIISTFRFISTTVVEMHAIACQPQYTRSEFAVVVNASTARIEGIPRMLSSIPITLPDEGSLLYWVYDRNRDIRESGQDDNDFGNPWPWPHAVLPGSPDGYATLRTWINLLGRVRNITEGDILDPNRLGNLSADVFQEIFPYVSLSAYAQPSYKMLNGTRTVYASRIFTKDPSIRAVQASLCILIIITAALYLGRPITHLVEDPGPILASVGVLAASQMLSTRLTPTGAMSEQELNMHLDNMTCVTGIDGGGKLMVYAADHSKMGLYSTPTSITCSLPTAPLWRPLMLAWPLRTSILVFLSGCVAALEVLYWRSEREGGLIDLMEENVLEHYSWAYLAPAILFVLGLALACVDSAIRVTEPFRLMTSHPQPIRILDFNPNFANLFTLGPNALMRRQYSTALISMTALLLPVAKIVLAGLFINGDTEASLHIPLRLQTQFKDTFNSTLDFGLWTFMQDGKYNLPRPSLTTDTHAVASCQWEPLHADNMTSSITARLPVGYATLGECERIETKVSSTSSSPGTSHITFSFANHSSCPAAQYTLVQELNSLQENIAVVWDPRGAQGCGEKIHFIVGPLYNSTTLACDWDLTTSSMLVTMASGETPTILDIDITTERNRTVVPITWDDGGALWTGYNFTSMLPNMTSDSFFTGLFASERGVDISGNLNPAWLEMALRRYWSSFWALQFDQKMRVPAESAVDATKRYRVARLKMATIPTRILQALLGAILIIVFGVCVSTPLRSVLPKPPYSIAAQMSLISGSLLLRHVSEGGSLNGLHVMLRWWRDDNVEGGRRYGIDIVENCEEGVPLSNVFAEVSPTY